MSSHTLARNQIFSMLSMRNTATTFCKKLLTDWKDANFFTKALIALLPLFFAWNLLTSIINQESIEAVVSSGRLLFEGCVLFLLLRYGKNISGKLMWGVVGFASLNSLLVLWQILESANVIPTNLSHIVSNFWDLPQGESSRRTGLMNGYQSAGFLSMIAILCLLRRGSKLSRALIALNCIAVFFGSRTILLFLPFILMVNWRAALLAVAAISTMFLINAGELRLLLVYHITERLMPVVTMNTIADPTVKDMMSQYRPPGTKADLWLGNGHPRYSDHGGVDATASRWLLQSGLPALVMILTIAGLVILKIFLLRGLENKILAVCLTVLTVKTEIVTSSVGFPILIIYALYEGFWKRRKT
jgi:hypothetical protein